MMHRTLLLALALFALACGNIVSSGVDAGVDSGLDSDARPPDPCDVEELPFEELEICFGRAFCSFFDCLSGISLPFCQGEITEFAFYEEMEQYVEAGTIVYDPVAGAACVSELLQCASTDADISGLACDSMFLGTLVDGQLCFNSEECGSAGSCEDADCPDQCCAGVCEDSNRPLYSECVSSCDVGLFCVENPDTSVRTCQMGNEGAPCNDARDCLADHYCTEYDTGSLGTCEPDVAEFEECEGDAWCPSPLRCLGDDLSIPSGTCRRVDTQGDDCDNDANELFEFRRPCFGDLYCLQPTMNAAGTCEPYPGEDGDCGDSNRCLGDELFCSPGDVCVPKPGSGDACPNGLCANGVVCLPDDTCGEPVANGEPCDDDFQCLSLNCIGPDMNKTCEPFGECR